MQDHDLADSFPQANPHYLDRMIEKGHSCDIEAGEDIYSANGIKLVARGTRISDAMRERLLVHKLLKPLEKSVAIRCGMNRNALLAQAETLLDENAEQHPLLNDRRLLNWIATIPLNSTLNGFLSLADNDEQILQHGLLVALTALGLGARLQCSDESMRTIATAALMHDLGELYIEPHYLDRKKPLNGEEWRHVSVHPIIGCKIACELCNLDQAVGRAILEHHERGDGCGYPRGLTLEQLSWEGQIIGAAETIASMARLLNHPMERAELALRMIPGEFDRQIISTFREAVKTATSDEVLQPMEPAGETAEQTFERIAAAFHLLENAQSDIEKLPHPIQNLIERICRRFSLIKRIFSSAGLDQPLEAFHDQNLSEEENELLMHEIGLILHELHWRMGELARDISCRASLLTGVDTQVFEQLADILQPQYLIQHSTQRVHQNTQP